MYELCTKLQRVDEKAGYQYKRAVWWKFLVLAAAFLSLLVLFVFDISYGPGRLRFMTVIQAIFNADRCRSES